MARVLLVDDEARILLLLKNLLQVKGYAIETAKDGNTALDIVRKGGIDIVITDFRMEPMDGLTLFKKIHELRPSLPVILLTAYASVENAIEIMKGGAFDYLTKPFKVDDMLACLKRAETKILRDVSAVASAESALSLTYQFDGMIATSPAMAAVCDTIRKVAASSSTVLINGESGTGKEVVARAIHNSSPRAKKPMVAVNCAALPEELLESEMFGHKKGAFTGAHADKEGLFAAADGGTLFLDEISSMPLMLQGKLLRALQEGDIRPIGDTKDRHVDVRIIAASNTDLEQAVVAGRFRSDLYYRLAVITIDLPPLRKRAEDVLPLARHFIEIECKDRAKKPVITPEAAKILVSCEWPGNVRELENAIKHAVTFCQDGDITPDVLPQRVREHVSTQPQTFAGDGSVSLKAYIRQKEREYIEQILSTNGGDKEKAAESLQVNLSTLYRKLSEP